MFTEHPYRLYLNRNILIIERFLDLIYYLAEIIESLGRLVSQALKYLSVP